MRTSLPPTRERLIHDFGRDEAVFTVGNVLLSLGAMGLSLFMLAGLRRRKS
jgi:hypothetical protein